jgi:hypothetical protein
MREFADVLTQMEAAVDAPATYEAAARLMIPVVAGQVRDSFSQRMDPDGEPWAPLKQPSRSKGAMRHDALVAVMDGVLSSTGYESAAYLTPFYRWFQNDGTRRIPARPFWGVGEATEEKAATAVAGEVAERLVG